MREGRERSEWSRCSVQLALIQNGFASLGKGGKFLNPDDFNPFKKSEPVKVSVLEFGQMLGFKYDPSKPQRFKKGGRQCASPSPRSESSPSSS